VREEEDLSKTIQELKKSSVAKVTKEVEVIKLLQLQQLLYLGNINQF
jgi:hypothetical protein